MSKIDEAIEVLTSLGLPKAQRNQRSALTLLALANIRPKSSWKETQPSVLRIWDIMSFMRKHYKKDYAANSRETIRRQTIHQFEQARLVDRNPDEPLRPTNSGKTVYVLTDDVVQILKFYGTPKFERAVTEHIAKFGSLQEAYSRSRNIKRVSLRLADGALAYLSPGIHNVLQVAIIEQFGPLFAPGALLLYVGDTARKHVICDTEQLAKLGVNITQHDKLPDVILYWPEKNFLYLIEAVTSHGPVSAKRHREIEATLKKCPASRIYLTAFQTLHDFRKYAAEIAWETEVWIADQPSHMIHFNGPKFLGPYELTEK